jgi:hypothetical protein
MKCFVELECKDIDKISSNIYEFLKNQGLLDTIKFGWNFVDCKELLKNNKELVEFFKEQKLIPRHSAVTRVEDNSHLPKHIDELPVIVKINIPVINTTGWANRWYINNEMVAELLDMKQPIAFNSQIVHSVEKLSDSSLPRIIASFTFYNEPLHLLT